MNGILHRLDWIIVICCGAQQVILMVLCAAKGKLIGKKGVEYYNPDSFLLKMIRKYYIKVNYFC